MHSVIFIHADEGLDLYNALAHRPPSRVSDDRPLFRGELGEITTVTIKPDPERAVLVNIDDGSTLRLPLSKDGTLIIPEGRWKVHYVGNGLAPTYDLTVSGGDVSATFRKQVLKNRVNTPWYQQFDKRRASPKPKR